jgi:hypothetical protein
MEGATQNIEPCTACETRPGESGTATRNHFDYVAKWIRARS